MKAVKVIDKSGGAEDAFLGAPPTSGDVIVGVASVQTLTNKTLTAPVLTSPVLTTPSTTSAVQVLAAAGSVQGDAGAITASPEALIHVTGADATKGVVLPAAAAGKKYLIKNSDAANAVLKVYPAGTNIINALSASAAISMAAKTSAVFMAIDATTWITCPLLPS